MNLSTRQTRSSYTWVTNWNTPKANRNLVPIAVTNCLREEKKKKFNEKKISMNLNFPFSAFISAFLLVGELYVLLHVDL